ncbi:MAG: hypothetical protein LBH26_07270 [Treponema sp.]|jgi:hypothetical protein|nr:hypothetical protein [Treponema sp.]
MSDKLTSSTELPGNLAANCTNRTDPDRKPLELKKNQVKIGVFGLKVRMVSEVGGYPFTRTFSLISLLVCG